MAIIQETLYGDGNYGSDGYNTETSVLDNESILQLSLAEWEAGP